MSEQSAPRPPRLPLLRQFFDYAYLAADHAIDRGQRHAFRLLWFFLPETSIAKEPRFQQVAASRFFSDAGQQALAYGALIAVARNGGSALDLALIGVAALLPAGLLGLYGGAVADELPKRVALAGIYNLQAACCFLVPLVGGTDLAALFVLILVVNTLGQVSGPTESAVLPLVATEEQLASAASLVHLVASAGTAFGAALLAPVLVLVFGTQSVMYVAGVLLLIAATRVFDLPTGEPPRKIRLVRPTVGVVSTLQWLARQPAVSSMIFVAVLTGTANLVLQTLAPRYVVAALHVDAANTVYVFAPSAAGLIVALAVGPSLMKLRGERIAALAGFFVITVSLILFGRIGDIAPVLDPVNPVRLLSLIGVDLGLRLRAAALLSPLLGFGVALTTTSVQTYVNRRVPLGYQGRAFALQSTLKNGVAIVPLLALGSAAGAFGVERILVAAPIVLLTLAYLLVQLSFRFAGLRPVYRLDVFSSYWHEAAAAEPAPDATPT